MTLGGSEHVLHVFKLRTYSFILVCKQAAINSLVKSLNENNVCLTTWSPAGRERVEIQ